MCSKSTTGFHVLDHESSSSFLNDIDTLLFDCDGVLWKGSSLIPGADQALQAFRRQGKRLLFVTNNASKSRAAYVSRFSDLGIEGVTESDVISASYAAAAYLSSQGFKKKVFLIGNRGVEEELQIHGIPFIGGEAPSSFPFMGDTDMMLKLEARLIKYGVMLFLLNLS